jgi:hypothetical protein
MPRGSKTVGSFEAWAAVMGGILDVVSVPGFLGNIDEMLEASDGEGAVWRVFVRQWWDRFGTADVGTSELYELALACEPPLPLGGGGDHSRRIRLGKSLARMRDRMFDIAGLKARVSTLGISHQARRWKLTVDGECGECFSGLQKIENGECQASDAQYSPRHSPGQPIDHEGVGEGGEYGEYFPTLTHARAYTILKEGDSNSPYSQHSPTSGNHSRNSGECGGECRPAHPPRFDPPDWLKEVP